MTRFITRVVSVGNIPLGGKHPVRIQSMINVPTLDTKKAVQQTIKLFDAGADYVRITTASIKEAENLIEIKNKLYSKGYQNPIIADVHFNPQIALIAAKLVEKVRINPGNYSDKNPPHTYSTNSYNKGIEEIKKKFIPLLDVCRQYNTAIRIGVNHGSISNRIVSKFGHTPQGMVEAAMEFLRICINEHFYNVVLSLKASDVRFMVYSYRLAVAKMIEEGMNFPLHLGVTEAGNGIEARIKSAVGIGTLLAEGIGDTIRVSLSEPPENEIPVAKLMIKNFSHPIRQQTNFSVNPIFSYSKSTTKKVKNVGGNNFPVVISNTPYSINKKKINSFKPNYFYLPNLSKTSLFTSPKLTLPINEKYLSANAISFISIFSNNLKILSTIKSNTVLVVKTSEVLSETLKIFNKIKACKINNPIIITYEYTGNNIDDFIIKTSVATGSCFIDGKADGIWLSAKHIDNLLVSKIAFGILQATKVRISQNEYISCPTCGRTQIDIEKSLNLIKQKTLHISGLRIAVMGCIVNGPGEMAGADYGFVGSGKNTVTLYKKNTIIKKNIPHNKAVDELIKLINKKI